MILRCGKKRSFHIHVTVSNKGVNFIVFLFFFLFRPQLFKFGALLLKLSNFINLETNFDSYDSSMETRCVFFALSFCMRLIIIGECGAETLP